MEIILGDLWRKNLELEALFNFVLLSTRGIHVQECPSLPWEAMERFFFIFHTSWLEAKAVICSYCIILAARERWNCWCCSVGPSPSHFRSFSVEERPSLSLGDQKRRFWSSYYRFGIRPYVYSHAQRNLLPLQCYFQRWLAQGIRLVHQ